MNSRGERYPRACAGESRCSGRSTMTADASRSSDTRQYSTAGAHGRLAIRILWSDRADWCHGSDRSNRTNGGHDRDNRTTWTTGTTVTEVLLDGQPAGHHLPVCCSNCGKGDRGHHRDNESSWATTEHGRHHQWPQRFAILNNQWRHAAMQPGRGSQYPCWQLPDLATKAISLLRHIAGVREKYGAGC